MKILFTAALMFIFAAYSYADVVQINVGCVYAADLLGENQPNVAIQCGFRPGDTKIIPSNIVATAYRRVGLVHPALPPNFTIHRAGVLISAEAIRQEILAAYTVAHPTKEITIETLRTGGQDVYIAPETRHELEFDVNKFGSNHGVLRAGDVRSHFSFLVRVYEEVYVTTGRVSAGSNLADFAKLELVDVTNVRGVPVKNIDRKTVSRALPKGRVLTTELLETMPERVKGDPILLVYNDGVIRLEISAVAEGNAVVGKSFPVRNPTSGKIFTAVYQGNGVAVAN